MYLAIKLADKMSEEKTISQKNPLDKTKKREKSTYFLAMIAINSIIVITWISLIFIGFPSDHNKQIDFWNYALLSVNCFSFGLGMFAIHIIYTLLSLCSIGEDRLAILLFFGRYVMNLPSGLAYVPFPFFTTITVSKRVFESDLPASPEKIYHGDLTEEGSVPDGMVPAIRPTFAAPQKDQDLVVKIKDKNGNIKEIVIPKDDPFLKRLSAELEISYGWKVVDLISFYRTMNTVKKASSTMDDQVIKWFTNRIQRITVAEAMLRGDEIAEEVKQDLIEYSADWGIEVTFVALKPFGQSHTLNSAVSAVSVANEKLKSTIFDIEGKAREIRQLGQAKADAHKALLEATAKGNEDMAKLAETPEGQFVAGLDVLRETLPKTNTIITPVGELFGLVASANELLKSKNNEKDNREATLKDTPKQLPTKNSGQKRGKK